MQDDVEDGMGAAAAFVHDGGGGGPVLVGHVDVDFDVLLGSYVAHGQVLDVRTGAGVFAHAQSGSALTRNVGPQQVVDLLVVDLVTRHFNFELILRTVVDGEVGEKNNNE